MTRITFNDIARTLSRDWFVLVMLLAVFVLFLVVLWEVKGIID